MRMSIWSFVAATLCLALVGCGLPAADHSAYRPYMEHMPQSILVLPPINHSANVHASEAFLATVTVPLAEAGYYVYPVAVVDRLMKDNGVPTPGDMHSVSLAKIDEVIGPDAVLYIDIREWTTTYIGIDSTTKVTMDYRLVHTRTGVELWKNSGTFAYSSSEGAAGLATSPEGLAVMVVAMAISAQMHALAAATSDGAYERDAATQANANVFWNPNAGVLKGAHYPGYAADQKRMQDLLAQEALAREASAKK